MTLLSFYAAALSMLAQNVPLVDLPLTVHTHGLYLPVRVNRGTPIQFQFDSAAGWHVVNWKLAEAWHVPMREHTAGANGAGDGRTRAAQISGATVQLGALEVPLTPAAAVDLDPTAERKGIELNGLLGAPILKRYVVETDAGAARFRVYDPATWRYTGKGQALPLRVDAMGVPHLRVSFTIGDGPAMEGEFKIDSAAGGTTLYFSSAFAEKHGLLAKARATGRKVLADEVGGVGGSSKIWLTRIASVRVGETTFAGPVAGITEAKGGTLARADIAGIIGGGLLHRFNVIYDCPHQRIYLEPSPRLALPFHEEMAGLRWLTSGPRRNQFRVRAVLPDTPAARAGIQPGDVLVRIDGRPAESFDRDTLAACFQTEGRTVRLTLLRGGDTVEAALRLARLL